MNRFILPFLVMTALGLPGIATLIPTARAAIETMRALPGAPALPDAELIALVLLQPLLLLAIGAAIGAGLSERVGLVSIVARLVRGRPPPAAATGGFGATIGLATASALAVVVSDALARAAAPGPVRSLVPTHATWSEFALGLLYGGITEELVMRYGLMTLLVAFGALLAPKIFARRPQRVVWPAIALTALAFGAGHLPAAMLAGPLPTELVVRMLLLNGLVGMVYGWLYWRRSLEHAMLAHGWTHCVFWLAGPFFSPLASV